MLITIAASALVFVFMICAVHSWLVINDNGYLIDASLTVTGNVTLIDHESSSPSPSSSSSSSSSSSPSSSASSSSNKIDLLATIKQLQNIMQQQAVMIANLQTRTPIPVGAILPFAGSQLPSGYLYCDGSAYNISNPTYSILFAAIGYSFACSGGLSSSVFCVPDTRGQTIVGSTTGLSGVSTPRAGISTRIVGSTVGEETHTLSVEEMPSHSHGVYDPAHSHSGSWYSGRAWAVGGGQQYARNDAVFDTAGPISITPSITGVTINPAGSSAAHNNMQPSIVCHYIIKYVE